MNEGGFVINMWEEVMMAMKVKWWVKDRVVDVVVIVLEQLVRRRWDRCDWNSG
jgi:hypothetical protein